MTSFSQIASLSALLVTAGCSKASTPEAAPASPAAASVASTPLTGAWESHVQFTSGPYASIKDMRFLYSFNAGGTMTESSNYDEAQPVTPAYGVWRQTGPTTFDAKYYFYNTRPPATFQEIAKNGGWLPTGHGILTEHITLGADGNSFESTMHWEAFDMADKPAPGSGDATTHGSRISF